VDADADADADDGIVSSFVCSISTEKQASIARSGNDDSLKSNKINLDGRKSFHYTAVRIRAF
jgi:hypothetical protein